MKKRALALALCLVCLCQLLTFKASAEADAGSLAGGDAEGTGTEHTSFISGYDDGSFRPDAPLTRAEACAILLKLLPSDLQPSETGPAPESAAGNSVGNETPPPPEPAESGQPEAGPDVESVPEPWYAEAVSAMYALGLLTPDENGGLRAEEAITRAEFISMLASFYPIYPAEAEFSDLSFEHPAYAEIAFAADMGWAGGYEDGTFRPDAPLTRAEAVTLLCRALGRTGDGRTGTYRLRRFTDLPPEHWAFRAVMEAAVPHISAPEAGGGELWTDYPVLYLEPGFQYTGGELFYVSPETGWYVSDTTVNGFRFGSDGRYTSGSAELDGYVRHTLAQLSQDGMTREELLHAAFNYTRDSFSYLRRSYYETGHTGWEMENALVMFQTRRGNCYCYASVFYYLARQLGYEATAIAGGVGYSRAPHGWVEIDFDGVTCIFDPELEMSYRARGVYQYDFYMMPYSRIPWPYDGPPAAPAEAETVF